MSALDGRAEACAKYLAKGRAIAVTGRLIYREWVADDGTRRSKHAIVGHVQFGGRPNDEQPNASDHTDDHKPASELVTEHRRSAAGAHPTGIDEHARAQSITRSTSNQTMNYLTAEST